MIYKGTQLEAMLRQGPSDSYLFLGRSHHEMPICLGDKSNLSGSLNLLDGIWTCRALKIRCVGARKSKMRRIAPSPQRICLYATLR